jgi:hypothetical protein
MAQTAEQALLAKVQLADNIMALVRGSGLLGAKRGRKPGAKKKAAATGEPPKKRGRKPKAKPAEPTPQTNGGDTQQSPAVGEE